MRYKYLLLLGLLPANASMLSAQEPQQTASATYSREGLTEREVVVGAPGFELPGTLTLPLGASVDAKVPCLILVHGSGPNDRDETLGPNKPFRDLAWGLAEQGIATLRYDKRTRVYGANCVPAGRELDYDTEVVDDAVAIVAWAKRQPELLPEGVFLLGHSLGGSLAPRIAERVEGLAGVVIMAGVVRSLGEVLLDQVTYIASLSGTVSPEVQAQLDMLKLQIDNVKKLDTVEFDSNIPLPMGLPASYWRMENAYRPAEVAARLSLPMLILQGERDYQATMTDFGLWQINLLGRSDVTYKAYPGLNHLMQEGEGKAVPQEYMKVAPVAPYVITDIAGFIRSRLNL